MEIGKALEIQAGDSAQDGSTGRGIQDASQGAAQADAREHEGKTGIIVAFLLEKVPEYRRLTELRQRGWDNPAATAFFRKQRSQADRGNQKTALFHFDLMKRIGQELQYFTCGFDAWHTDPEGRGSVLDMCAAPGGFLATALHNNAGCHIEGFTLPFPQGGHKLLFEAAHQHCVKHLDITMLAADMGVEHVPEDHPDANNFLARQLETDEVFDLVLCDGQVLRTHARAAYRVRCESIRLSTTQLALGLEHLRTDGKMVILCHKIEAWDSAVLLYTLSQFSNVRVHKPTAGHGTRSSFYIVATNVQSKHPQALEAIEKWKNTWRAATFGTEDDLNEARCHGDPTPEQLLAKFGSELVRLGEQPWKVQTKFLAKASFIKKSSKKSLGKMV